MAERKKTVDTAVEMTATEEITPVEEAVAEAAPATVEEAAPATVEKAAPAEVPVRLVYNDDHKRPLFVCVNGVSKKIPRGKTVMVPPEFAAAIENAMNQEEDAIRYQDAMAYKDPDVN